MLLYKKLGKLISHYQFKKNLCTSEISRLSHKENIFSLTIKQLNEEVKELTAVMNSKKLFGEISLSKLFEHKRTDAVFKRKIAELQSQKKDIILKREKIVVELKQCKAHFRIYSVKLEKYALLNQKDIQAFIRRRRINEESSIEELSYGKN